MRIRLYAAAVAALLTAGTAVAQDSNPTDQETAAARGRGPCGDPWVTIALERVYGRVPSRAHCVTGLYNNGQWGSFAQLLGAVRAGSYSFRPVPIEGSGPLTGKFALGIFSANTLVAAGGGNLVAAGGGNLVAAGGGNLVAAGGGNIILQSGQQLISPGGRYTLQSGTPVRVVN